MKGIAIIHIFSGSYTKACKHMLPKFKSLHTSVCLQHSLEAPALSTTRNATPPLSPELVLTETSLKPQCEPHVSLNFLAATPKSKKETGKINFKCIYLTSYS